MASSSEEQRHEQQQEPPSPPSPLPAVKECVHKTKLIQFLGRTTPIVLQNDNGPCPLLAICNVLLLRNNLNLSPDTTEVSQEKLLSLVAERLIDSNSDFNNKDEGYVENQQQNISDAIDLLPRLATGIDVNIKFRRIDDFEFTPECAIFDLLDIPLYHGWIVDPEDKEPANAIGSKSYNALVEELVALDTQDEHQYRNVSEEDCVDFAAATTATLGVPSPSLSKARSFDDSPHLDFEHQNARKGDLEEETELLRALKLSEAEWPSSLGDPIVADINKRPELISSDESPYPKKVFPVGPVDTSEKYTLENSNFHKPDLSTSDDCNASRSGSNDVMLFQSTPEKGKYSSPKANEGNNLDLPNYVESDGHAPGIDSVQKSSIDALVQVESYVSLSSGRSTASLEGPFEDISRGNEKIDILSNSTVDVHEFSDKKNECDSSELSCLLAPNADLHSDSSSGRHVDTSEALTSSVDGSEPIYEGEECILDSGTTVFEDREPVYEGEVVLANQADKSTLESRPKDAITPQAGELIRNFLKYNASQLTFTGLFCLLEGLKERELCVFFRNNHFSTMFKFNGELFLLATDQGYINQTDLVWEKLNEVNGDTLFMTGNFKEFKVENHANDTWDEHNAMTTTADYIASIDSAAQAGVDINPDLQLAIALQQQEFDQQPQRQNTQQQPTIANSRLVTGPTGPRSGGRNSTLPSRPEPKSKDKCTVM
ncbi:uncharacterized protein LOC21405916 isoform X1 [Morus notabilis]|uniref:uncharacterized protein LOC21405916 isoform X1 n=1 Tax=Morus notabilis TaxID=981085 RepID=UPI000CED0B58|nr:uncharacterized protein LOC21405916 isoform X1 [Morus notabilis]